MSGNHPPYKSFIFPLFTCSLSFFPHLFEKSSVTWGDVELHHLSRRIKFYSLTFSLWSSICEAIFFKLFGNQQWRTIYNAISFFDPWLGYLKGTISVTVGTLWLELYSFARQSLFLVNSPKIIIFECLCDFVGRCWYICLVTIKMKRYIYRVKIAKTNRN